MKTSTRFTHSAIPSAFSALAMLVMLSACTVGPDFQHPAAGSSQHYDEQAEQSSGDQRFDMGQRIHGDWWTALRSPKLDQLMRRAIDGNLEPVSYTHLTLPTSDLV